MLLNPIPLPLPETGSAPLESRLDDVGAGGSFVVVGVDGDDALSRRLAGAGIWPGVEIELIVRAPFGDPLLFRVHGYRLALRRSEAERVLVRAAGEQA